MVKRHQKQSITFRYKLIEKKHGNLMSEKFPTRMKLFNLKITEHVVTVFRDTRKQIYVHQRATDGMCSQHLPTQQSRHSQSVKPMCAYVGLFVLCVAANLLPKC